MTTIRDLIDRTFRSYLEPPNEQPARTQLATDLLIGTATVRLTAFEVPEDEQLVRIGSIVEVAQELMRVLDFDVNTLDLTLDRGVLGTTEADHTSGDYMKLHPPFPRKDVFEAVQQNIVGLYPKLWTVVTENLLPVGANIYPVVDPLISEFIDARFEYDQFTTVSKIHGTVIDYHELAEGRALILNAGAGGIYARFRRRFGVATDEDTTLASLGLEKVWENLVVIGTAADLIAGRDISRIHSDWVGSVLEAESVQVGTDSQVAVSLARYRELLIERYSQEMEAEQSYGISVQMNDPFTQVV